MIGIRPKNTVASVAEELAEGLASGSIIPESEALTRDLSLSALHLKEFINKSSSLYAYSLGIEDARAELLRDIQIDLRNATKRFWFLDADLSVTPTDARVLSVIWHDFSSYCQNPSIDTRLIMTADQRSAWQRERVSGLSHDLVGRTSIGDLKRHIRVALNSDCIRSADVPMSVWFLIIDNAAYCRFDRSVHQTNQANAFKGLPVLVGEKDQTVFKIHGHDKGFDTFADYFDSLWRATP